MSYWGMTARTKGICENCKHDDEVYESDKCASCKNNPWLDDNYEEDE